MNYPSLIEGADTATNGGKTPRTATCPKQEEPEQGVKEMRGEKISSYLSPNINIHSFSGTSYLGLGSSGGLSHMLASKKPAGEKRGGRSRGLWHFLAE